MGFCRVLLSSIDFLPAPLIPNADNRTNKKTTISDRVLQYSACRAVRICLRDCSRKNSFARSQLQPISLSILTLRHHYRQQKSNSS
ncbi:hypothetical protein Nepgr_016145 [Nepenthes gracilis]|uniref:Uncharacterized protein n=1 Tax=Nepenthes gracilis TaxID=150966 RepID=A0AAD3SP86_NEPGR|nr:hypothetical protein Nepgr_016145 [Nepenthes gracilis]